MASAGVFRPADDTRIRADAAAAVAAAAAAAAPEDQRRVVRTAPRRTTMATVMLCHCDVGVMGSCRAKRGAA